MKSIKKFLFTLTALVMCVGVFSFTACDFIQNVINKDKGTDTAVDGADEKNDGNESDEDKDNGIKTVLTEDTDFEALVSEKVTAEEWENVFADNSKYSNCTFKSLYKQLESTDIYYAKHQTVDEELYILQSDNHSDVVTYVHCVDGSVYAYAPGQTTDWELILGHNEDVIFDGGYEPFYKWLTTYRSWCPDFGDFFDRFTYNEELGQYEFLGGDNNYISTNSVGSYGGNLSNYYRATVKIINCRLAYVTFGDEICYFYDFNNSAFDIPNIEGDYDEETILTENTDFEALVSEKVTAEEWAAAFDAINFTDCTIRIKYVDATSYLYSQIKDGNYYWQVSTDYYSLVDGYFNIYSKQGGDTYSNIMSDKVENFGYSQDEYVRLVFNVFRPDFSNFYSEFSYDENQKDYVLNNSVTTNSTFESGMSTYYLTTIKFYNGKIVYIREGASSPTVNEEFCLYNFGTTVVTLPEVE